MSSTNDNTEPNKVFASISYFADLPTDLLDIVVRAAVRRTYEADETVFFEGEPSPGLHLVEDGWLKAVRTSTEGREQVLRFVGPGEVVNEVGVFADDRNPATVIALEPSTLWVIDRGTIHRLLDEYPELARRVIESLAQRVLHLVSLVEDLSLRTVEARLARRLVDQTKDRTLQRRPWATQTEIAARLGTVLDVLNRALHTLAREGLIEVDRDEIRILDREGLRAKAMID